MEQLGWIIFLVIFLLILPWIAIYWAYKWVQGLFQDIRKTENERKKMEEIDDVSYKNIESEQEFHQYSFYPTWMSRTFSTKPIIWWEITKQQTLFYTLTWLSFLTWKYKYTEIVLRNVNTRYFVNNKIVITEHFWKFYILYTWFITYLFTAYWYSFILGVCTLLFFAITNKKVLETFMNENSLYLVIYMLTVIPISIPAISVLNPRRFITLLKQQSMESLEFEDSFDAYSKDPIEARTIITPALMVRVEQFSKQWWLKWKIRIIWKWNDIIFAIKWDIDTLKWGDDFLISLQEYLNLSYYKI